VSAAGVPRTRLDDAALFGVTALFVAMILVGAGVVSTVVAAAAPDSILARLAPPATVSALYGWFLVLPALLAFVGIGGPAFVRSLSALRRGALERSRAVAAVAALVSVPAMLVAPGAAGVVFLLAALAASARAAGRPALAVPAGVVVWTAAGQVAALIALLRFGGLAAAGEDPGFALAPTAALIAGFCSWTSLWTSALAALAERTSRRLLADALALGAALVWPLAAWTQVPATVELGGFALAAVLAVALAVVARRGAS
jgi:hypothetical protein